MLYVLLYGDQPVSGDEGTRMGCGGVFLAEEDAISSAADLYADSLDDDMDPDDLERYQGHLRTYGHSDLATGPRQFYIYESSIPAGVTATELLGIPLHVVASHNNGIWRRSGPLRSSLRFPIICCGVYTNYPDAVDFVLQSVGLADDDNYRAAVTERGFYAADSAVDSLSNYWHVICSVEITAPSRAARITNLPRPADSSSEEESADESTDEEELADESTDEEESISTDGDE